MNKEVTVDYYIKFLFIRIYYIKVPHSGKSGGFVIGNYLSERRAEQACKRLNEVIDGVSRLGYL